MKQHDNPAAYRAAVNHIKHDPLSLGALVTTHKIDLLAAARDLFDELDPYAELLGEVSSISKCNGALSGHAKDPITSGLALESFLPANHWRNTGAEAFILGAGGSSIAISCYLMKETHGMNRPSRIVVSNRSLPRLEDIRRIHQSLKTSIVCEYAHTPRPEDNDHILHRLKPGSLVINATGLGKDAPGSPISDHARFPEDGIAWDFNYRGELLFLRQARIQSETRRLRLEDGWVYFLHGWTRVLEEVFHIRIPSEGPVFNELSQIAVTATTK